MSETIRAFIAIEIPEELKKKLCDFADQMKSPADKISWVNSSNIHLTFKFLGNIPIKDIDSIKKALIEISELYTIFPANIKGTGLFPAEKNPRVVWAGIDEGSEKISTIFNSIEEKLSVIGIPKDNRGFTPHFTLGRIKNIKNLTMFLDKISKHKEDLFGNFDVNGISLIKSTLTQKGSIYEILYTAKLQKREE